MLSRTALRSAARSATAATAARALNRVVSTYVQKECQRGGHPHRRHTRPLASATAHQQGQLTQLTHLLEAIGIQCLYVAIRGVVARKGFRGVKVDTDSTKMLIQILPAAHSTSRSPNQHRHNGTPTQLFDSQQNTNNAHRLAQL